VKAMDRKTYKKVIWEKSISKARQKYDVKADAMKTVFGILLTFLVVIVLLGIGWRSKTESIPGFILTLFGANIFILVGTYLFAYIVAYFDRWNIAAEIDAEKEQRISELENQLAVDKIEINLALFPQEKSLDGDSYIIIGITNNESKAVSCRVEIRGIYNEIGENIKREISQYANLFSWSGGSQNGTKEILAGLDETANIVVRRTNAYGIYFLFHENSDTNWKIGGIYSVDVVINGKIGEIDFIGKRLIIKFEYIQKEEIDSYGQFFNRGILKLLGWKTDENL
jgi:hypothetical protein